MGAALAAKDAALVATQAALAHEALETGRLREEKRQQWKSHGEKNEAEKAARLQAQLNSQRATVAEAQVSLRMDGETREFFETLMQEEPPAEQKYLRLLIDNQLTTLRNCKH